MHMGVTAYLSATQHIGFTDSTFDIILQAPCCQRSPACQCIEVFIWMPASASASWPRSSDRRRILCKADGRFNADAGQPAAIKLLQQHFEAYRLDALIMPTTPAASRFVGVQPYISTLYVQLPTKRWPAANIPDSVEYIKLLIPSDCMPCMPSKAAQAFQLFSCVDQHYVDFLHADELQLVHSIRWDSSRHPAWPSYM